MEAKKLILIVSCVVLSIALSLLSARIYLASFDAYTPDKSEKAEHYYVLAKALERQDYIDEAESFYKKSLEIEKKSFVYNALGHFYHNVRDSDIKALESFKNGISANKTDLENYFDAADIYFEIGEFEEGDAYLAEAGRIKNTSDIYNAIGVLYIQTKQYMKAEKAFRQSLEIEEKALTYNNLGITYEFLGKKQLAIENYEKALKIDPEYHTAEDSLARLKK